MKSQSTGPRCFTRHGPLRPKGPNRHDLPGGIERQNCADNAAGRDEGDQDFIPDCLEIVESKGRVTF